MASLRHAIRTCESFFEIRRERGSAVPCFDNRYYRSQLDPACVRVVAPYSPARHIALCTSEKRVPPMPSASGLVGMRYLEENILAEVI
jgi:hypothetical protein